MRTANLHAVTAEDAIASAAALSVKTVSVIGLGYIGLPTASMFASTGLEVIGVDVSPRAIKAINAGSAHTEEGGLDELVSRCVASGRLRAVAAPVAADAFIIAVPKPVGKAVIDTVGLWK